MLAMTQSGGTLPDFKVILEHVVTVVLKQAKDSPMGIHVDVRPQSHATGKGPLTYQENNGTVKPLANWPQESAENTQDLCQLLHGRWFSH